MKIELQLKQLAQPLIIIRNLFLLLFCYAFFLSCNSGKEEKSFRVGFSQCASDVWRQNMMDEMKRELLFHPEIDFVLREAHSNSDLQVKQIQELVDEKIDLLIVSPNEAAPLTPIIDKVYKNGLPVIVVDRSIESDNYTAFIGANNYTVGANAGAYAKALLKGKGTVVEISGTPSGSSADIGRHKGFIDFIKQYPEIKNKPRYIADTRTNAWENHFGEYLLNNPDIALVYCHDDRVAFTVSGILKKTRLDKKIMIIGVDGLPGKNNGIDLVESGTLKATIFYPSGGKEAIETAARILENKPYKKENDLASSVIDSTNVRMVRLQNEKLADLQHDIDRSQKKIEDQTIISNNQTDIIYAISISLALALILGSVLFYYLRENRKINARLALQNEEILTQRDQLIELSKKAKEATEAKINFFTNISHEFRTPLTLILSPLEELIANPKTHFTEQQHLILIRKNVMRLLRLVNQLIDFRKIESEKMKINASENDLVLFINEIVHSFKDTAKKRNIDLRVLTNERSINLWFDVSLLDKVIFNLLSNAFKFTNDNGFIHVALEKNQAKGNVIIKIEDNGIGMSEKVLTHVFELFYQGNNTDQRGSGLGLSLSKELIELHHGNIEVSSKEGKGTVFQITMPLGKSHLDENEIGEVKPQENILYHDEKIYTGELTSTSFEKIPAEKEGKSAYSILIIEDNPDLLGYLTRALDKEYSVLCADNGISAIQSAFDQIPDLIISDIMIPGKDGLAVTNILKNDIRTSHIPIILLTARQAVEKQIEGMKSRADVYISKPFNMQFLEETIRSLMKNREILREHYTSEFSPEFKSQNPKKLDRKFISEFTSIIEANIPNEHFTIDDLCHKIGISRVQLYRKVKSLMGINVNDYILNVRLQKAKHYLSTGEFSIAEIAFKVGFSSASYFSTVFKSKYGITPKEYKEK